MLGIIGGTGLGDALFGEAFSDEHVIETPFGATSGPIRTVRWAGLDVAVLARHGAGHLLSPSSVPYRANVFALKKLGVTRLLVTGAVGSLREEIRPRDLIVVDQLVDRTYRRAPTFFDDGLAAHVELAQPYCRTLGARLLTSAPGAHAAATYVCIEGPSFSTAAESRAHRSWGADVVGMTAMPEARLAREAEMCCALLAFATDYDSWRPHADQTKRTLLEEIMGHLEAATESAIAVLRGTVEGLARTPDAPCDCHQALALGIWSQRELISDSTIDRYGPLVAKYLQRRKKST